MGAKEQYLELEDEIQTFRMNHAPYPITLIAVSKGVPVEKIKEVYTSGCRDFGESSLSEWAEKKDLLPSDIRWHFIGPLQTKKLPKLINAFALIHSVDSLEILKGIHERSQKAGVITPVLLEANTSGEETKKGLTPYEWEEVWNDCGQLTSVEIQGLMTMAPLTEDKTTIRTCFKALRDLRDRLIPRAFAHTPLYHLSMGMSNDWKIALDEGATILRIGTAIFKEKLQ